MRCDRSSTSRAITRPPTSTPEGARRSRRRPSISPKTLSMRSGSFASSAMTPRRKGARAPWARARGAARSASAAAARAARHGARTTGSPEGAHGGPLSGGALRPATARRPPPRVTARVPHAALSARAVPVPGRPAAVRAPSAWDWLHEVTWTLPACARGRRICAQELRPAQGVKVKMDFMFDMIRRTSSAWTMGCWRVASSWHDSCRRTGRRFLTHGHSRPHPPRPRPGPRARRRQSPWRAPHRAAEGLPVGARARPGRRLDRLARPGGEPEPAPGGGFLPGERAVGGRRALRARGAAGRVRALGERPGLLGGPRPGPPPRRGAAPRSS